LKNAKEKNRSRKKYKGKFANLKKRLYARALVLVYAHNSWSNPGRSCFCSKNRKAGLEAQKYNQKNIFLFSKINLVGIITAA
jgi:hypothetical protein